MRGLYDVFKDFSAMQLVAFTHAEGSPWNEVWTNNQYGVISKKAMKDWFKKFLENTEK